MMSNQSIKCLIALLGLLTSEFSHAVKNDPWEWIGSANFSFDSYLKSDTLHGQFEISFFLDAIHLENAGGGIGYVYQNQGISSKDDIVNHIMYYNGWFSRYPEFLPGKVNFALNYYSGSESTAGSGNNAPGNTGQNKPSPITTTNTFTDSLEIINPVISFINYSKTFYMDIGYAKSEYKTSDTIVGNLNVTQWSPAIGFSLNNQYDWIQLRQYNIELSNSIRTPGTDSTLARSLSWTHWLKKDHDETLDNISLILLSGERLYAVDHDARKIFNLSDMQTGSYIVGANWKEKTDIDYYIYGGYEKYRDVAGNDNYNSLFIYTGIKSRW
ncbi:MAG TPA: hypothetical protein VIQ03_10420 [Gammaproteobacteria bacterium]